jgi:hypothetical protein
MKKKRFVSLLLTVCLALSLLAVGAGAAPVSGTCGTGVTWSLSGGVLTISGAGEMTPSTGNTYGYTACKADITSVVMQQGVTSVGDGAFSGFPALTSVTAAASVKSVGILAFAGCSKLRDVHFQGTGITVNANGFSHCTGLTALPAGLGSLEMRAFFGCTGLTALNLYEGITYLDWAVFGGCSGAKSLSLPKSLTRVEFSAFDGCTGIETITAAEGSSLFSARDNLLVSSVYGGGKALVLAGRNKTGTVAVPDGVTEIEPTAFAGCTGVTAVSVPASVTAIYNSADGGDYGDELPAPVGCKNLKTVNYAGTKTQWAAVKIYDSYFKSAAVKFGVSGSTAPAAGAFTDVKAGSYCYDAVKWAVDKGITNGTTATTFSPAQTCTRGQIITFLWRASGSPEPKGSGALTDVAADSFCAKAAQWAAENTIAYPGAFQPSGPCTRASAVEFIWKQAGMPMGSPSAGFTDVPEGTEFTLAVDWAVAAGVTKGTSATAFSPFKTCTRGQIATFLYRALAGK